MKLVLPTDAILLVGNHYENLHEASLGVADKVKPTPTPPTTERKEELIKEVKSTKTQPSTTAAATPKKSASQLKKEAEEEAHVKQV